MRALLRRIRHLHYDARSRPHQGVSSVQMYVTVGCGACAMAKRSQLDVRLGHALGTRVQVVDCSQMSADVLAGLQQRGARAVPAVAVRLQDGAEVATTAQRVDALLSDFRGDARIFRMGTRSD